MQECNHKEKEKYLIPRRDKKGSVYAILLCVSCVTDLDLKPYGPGARKHITSKALRWTSEHQEWDDSMKTDKHKVGLD